MWIVKFQIYFTVPVPVSFKSYWHQIQKMFFSMNFCGLAFCAVFSRGCWKGLPHYFHMRAACRHFLSPNFSSVSHFYTTTQKHCKIHFKYKLDLTIQIKKMLVLYLRSGVVLSSPSIWTDLLLPNFSISSPSDPPPPHPASFDHSFLKLTPKNCQFTFDTTYCFSQYREVRVVQIFMRQPFECPWHLKEIFMFTSSWTDFDERKYLKEKTEDFLHRFFSWIYCLNLHPLNHF